MNGEEMPDAQESVATSIDELRRARELIAGLLGSASSDLRNYFDPGSNGFFHLLPAEEDKEPGDFSKASTATAVSFLVATGRASEDPWKDGWAKLRDDILAAEWKSAGLDENNPFTTAFMLEALELLQRLIPGDNPPAPDKVTNGLQRLTDAVKAGKGIEVTQHRFPPSAYVMQLAIRTLGLYAELDEELRRRATDWAWQKLNEELVILQASPRDGDPFEVGYAAVVIASMEGSLDPAGRETLAHALNEVFRTQLPDGTWPRGRPIFFYPRTGNAYCFEYEFLVQLLSQEALTPFLLEHVPALLLAVDALDRRKFPLESGFGWSSGHHRHLKYPESWSTASALHFCHNLDRFLAEVARRQVFEYVGELYRPPEKPTEAAPHLLESFLDSEFDSDGESYGIREVVQERFLQPLGRAVHEIRRGASVPRTVPTSAILFGPPGTSKTLLARQIADALGWPLLTIDPSHLLRHGSQQLHVEVFRLFRMLAECEQVVVLFDEFDELVRERVDDIGAESRFLTTAMLPRLQELSNSRRLVYIFATNHLEVFDVAIRRPGRFDMIVPLLPPTAAEKFRRWPETANRAKQLGIEADEQLLQQLSVLTFGEFEVIAEPLASASEVEFRQIVDGAEAQAILTSIATENETWEAEINQQIEAHLRLPRLAE